MIKRSKQKSSIFRLTEMRIVYVTVNNTTMKANKNLIAGTGSTSGCRTCSHNCSWALGMTVHTTSTSRALRIVSALQKTQYTSLPEKPKVKITQEHRQKCSCNEIINSTAAYNNTLVAFYFFKNCYPGTSVLF